MLMLKIWFMLRLLSMEQKWLDCHYNTANAIVAIHFDSVNYLHIWAQRPSIKLFMSCYYWQCCVLFHHIVFRLYLLIYVASVGVLLYHRLKGVLLLIWGESFSKFRSYFRSIQSSSCRWPISRSQPANRIWHHSTHKHRFPLSWLKGDDRLWSKTEWIGILCNRSTNIHRHL